MKPEIHPDYHDVIFVDSATGTEWTSRSTVTSEETREIDGIEVPVVRLEISAVSHPFWTGTQRELDADGKIDRFRKRYGGGKPAVSAAAASEDEAPAEAATEEEAPVEAATEEAPAEAAAEEAAPETPTEEESG
jgi:large subunit ribosomal protein L31